jgi:hypothetical protein
MSARKVSGMSGVPPGCLGAEGADDFFLALAAFFAAVFDTGFFVIVFFFAMIISFLFI